MHPRQPLVWRPCKSLTEQFLQGNVPLRHLLNEETTYVYVLTEICHQRSKWLGPLMTIPKFPLHEKSIPLGAFGQNPNGNCTTDFELWTSYLNGTSGIISPFRSWPIVVDPETLNFVKLKCHFMFDFTKKCIFSCLDHTFPVHLFYQLYMQETGNLNITGLVQ